MDRWVGGWIILCRQVDRYTNGEQDNVPSKLRLGFNWISMDDGWQRCNCSVRQDCEEQGSLNAPNGCMLRYANLSSGPNLGWLVLPHGDGEREREIERERGTTQYIAESQSRHGGPILPRFWKYSKT